ncbi:MAG: hypothetical protein QOE14_2086 [Humisphaera sp.]|nr:hypothetical protein [Humisphaera sp.]
MPKQLTFVIMSATRTAADFDVLASQATLLKSRGRVEVGVSSVAERTLSDIPPGGSPWHDYTSCLPSLEKFFPHRDLQPCVDAEHVKRNQQLLREKLVIARRHKLAAAAQFHVPWLLPEAFFDKFPHLRGPRIDHPRRSRREAFAMCVDSDAGRAFYAEMFGQFAHEVGELSGVHLLTNDAGGGLCWADWQYIGPNGPAHCRDRNVGPRVRDLIDAMRAAAPNREIDFDLRGNFSDAELKALAPYHDDHFTARPQHGPMPRQISIGSFIDNPVLGIFDPVAMLKSLERLRDPGVTRVIVDFSANYSRGHELHEVSARVIEFLDASLAEPAHGLLARMKFLRKMCAKWVGEEQADLLLEALQDMHETFAYRAATVPIFTANYVGVSMRHINRPLVAIPEMLAPEEESYWLPHVFNPSVEEARRDYIDFHGGRLTAPRGIDQAGDPRIVPIATFRQRMNDVAARLAGLSGPGGEIFRRMAISLRLYASILRSCGNFYAVQRIRDRHLEKFAGPPRTPPKVADWHGDPDLQRLNEFMRDELDNTTELIQLLEAGGASQILTAADPADEDTFLLGPELIAQLKLKRRIMRRHWLDAERFLASPLK